MANVRWWLVFCTSIAALVLAANVGLLQTLWRNDPSYLGITIVGLYFLASVFVGYVTGQAAKSRWHLVYPHLPFLDYLGNVMFGLGLIGSMIGFIHGMQSMDFTDTAQMQSNMLKVMRELSGAGMTTVAGVLTSFLLRLQVLNLGYLLGDEEV